MIQAGSAVKYIDEDGEHTGVATSLYVVPGSGRTVVWVKWDDNGDETRVPREALEEIC